LDTDCAQTHFTALQPSLSLQGLLKPEALLAPSFHSYREREAAPKEAAEEGERQFSG